MSTHFKTLFLDVGGVLLTNGWGRHSRKLAADTFGLDYDEMDERHHLTYDTYEVGKITLSTYLDRVVFHKPRSFTKEEFTRFMYDRSQPYPDMIRYCSALKAAHHLKVGVISNEGRELTEYRFQKFSLSTFVDFFVSSSFVHFRKPDEDIFKLALDMVQVEPQDCVYVDDRPLFVEVARKLGMTSIHHQNIETTRPSLEVLGLSLE